MEVILWEGLYLILFGGQCALVALAFGGIIKYFTKEEPPLSLLFWLWLAIVGTATIIRAIMNSVPYKYIILMDGLTA